MKLGTRNSVYNCVNAIEKGYDGVKQIREAGRKGYFWVRESRARSSYSPSQKLYDTMFTYTRPNPDVVLYVKFFEGKQKQQTAAKPRRDARTLVWGVTYGMIRERAQTQLNRKLTSAELDEVVEAFAETMNELAYGWTDVLDETFDKLRLDNRP